MSRLPVRGALAVLLVSTSFTLVAAGCGSSSSGGNHATTDGGSSSGGSSSGTASSSGGSSSGTASSSGGSSSGTTSSSGGGDAGDAGCVFETLVVGVTTSTSTTPVPCSTPLCGCTDDGQVIPHVNGSF